jgi:hypothetical protein
MRDCPNGVKYYMQHQVWKPEADDSRGLGGDQINMALSSWNLLYGYTGDPAVKENMIYMADYWLSHGMSGDAKKWPDLPTRTIWICTRGFTMETCGRGRASFSRTKPRHLARNW